MQLQDIVIGIAIAGFVIYRQFAALPVNGRRLALLPALLAFFAARTIGSVAGVDPATAALLAVGAALGLALGWWRGMTYLVYESGGVVMSRGTWTTAVAWLVLIVLRAGMMAIAGLTGRGQSIATGDLLLGLAATFAAQSAAIWMRTQALRRGALVAA